MKLNAIIFAIAGYAMVVGCKKNNTANDLPLYDTVDCWACSVTIFDSTENTLNSEGKINDTCRLSEEAAAAYQRDNSTGYHAVVKDSLYRRKEVFCQKHN